MPLTNEQLQEGYLKVIAASQSVYPVGTPINPAVRTTIRKLTEVVENRGLFQTPTDVPALQGESYDSFLQRVGTIPPKGLRDEKQLEGPPESKRFTDVRDINFGFQNKFGAEPVDKAAEREFEKRPPPLERAPEEPPKDARQEAIDILGEPSAVDTILNAIDVGRGEFERSLTSTPLKAIAIAARALDRRFGKDKDLKSYALWAAGEKFDQYLAEKYPGDPRLAGTFSDALGRGAGSMAGFAATGATGGTIAVALHGAAMEGVPQFEAARKAGVSKSDQEAAAFWGGLVGASEIAGEPLAALRVFRRMDRASGGTIKKILSGMAIGGGVDAAQESVQQIGSNKVAQIYDKDRDLFDGVAQAGEIGGILGSFVHGFAVAAKTAFDAKGRQSSRGVPQSEMNPPERPILTTVDANAEPPLNVEPAFDPSFAKTVKELRSTRSSEALRRMMEKEKSANIERPNRNGKLIYDVITTLSRQRNREVVFLSRDGIFVENNPKFGTPPGEVPAGEVQRVLREVVKKGQKSGRRLSLLDKEQTLRIRGIDREAIFKDIRLSPAERKRFVENEPIPGLPKRPILTIVDENGKVLDEVRTTRLLEIGDEAIPEGGKIGTGEVPTIRPLPTFEGEIVGTQKQAASKAEAGPQAVEGAQAKGVLNDESTQVPEPAPPGTPAPGKVETSSALGFTAEKIKAPGAVSVDQLLKITRKGIKLAKAIPAEFRSRGKLPQQIFDAKNEMQDAVKSRIIDVNFKVQDLQHAIKKAKIDPGLVNQALGDPTRRASLPENVRDKLSPLRAVLDGLSRELIDIGFVPERLIPIFDKHMDFYFYRSYRAHTDPDWSTKVPQWIRDRFKSTLIQAFPEYNNNQLDNIINTFLYDASQAANPIAHFANGRFGANDLTSLIVRKDLSEAFRALLGEETDPIVNIVRSATRMANAVEMYRWQERVRDENIGKLFFRNDIPVVDKNGLQIVRDKDGNRVFNKDGTPRRRPNEKKGFVLETQPDPNIPPDATAIIGTSDSFGALKGLKTFPWLAEALDEINEPRRAEGLGRFYYIALFAAKLAKTIFSHPSAIRNFLANPAIELQNGNIAVWRGARGFKAMFADMSKMIARNKTSWRDILIEMAKYGIIDQNVNVQEFNVVAQKGFADLDEMFEGKGPAKWTAKKMLQTWQWGDTLYKAFGWATEIERYHAAFPEWTDHHVKLHTSKIIANTRPTARMIPKIIRRGQSSPLSLVAQNYLGFISEIIRNEFNIIKLMTKELADPRTRSIGAKRLVGTLAVAALPSGVALAIYSLFGINKEHERDALNLVFDYQKDSNILLLGNPKDGKLDYIDLSFTDPHTIIREPILAAMRSEEWENKFLRSAKNFVTKFVGENFIVKMFIDLERNRDEDGFAVYDEWDPAQAIKDIGKRVGEPFVPGSVTSLLRPIKAYLGIVESSGREYDFGIETIAQFGFRAQRLDVRARLQSLGFRFGAELSDKTNTYRRVVASRGPVSDEDVLDARRRSESARIILFKQMHARAMSAIALGVPEKDVFLALTSAGISKKLADDLIKDRYRPYHFSREGFKGFKKRTGAAPRSGDVGFDEIKRRVDLAENKQ